MRHECGDVLDGKFRLDRELGKGAIGVVFAATHLALGRAVAFKLLLPETLKHDELVERFAQEARIAVSIRSQHVVQVFDAGRLSSGEPYMAMALLEGEELSKVLKRRGPLPVDEVLEYAMQACEGLAAAHVLGIVHRDVKPANLFVTRDFDGHTILKMLDFGISKLSVDSGGGELETGTAVAMGTPAYAAPEQLRSARHASARSDLWSLGVILYEALAGHRPFRGESVADVCADVLTGRPPPLTRRDLPPGLSDVISRCLQREPAQRFPDMGALASALARVGPQELAVRAERVQRILAGGNADRGSSTPAIPASAPPVGEGAGRPGTARARWQTADGGVALSRSEANRGSHRVDPAAECMPVGTASRRAAKWLMGVMTLVAMGGVASAAAWYSRLRASSPIETPESTRFLSARSAPPASSLAPSVLTAGANSQQLPSDRGAPAVSDSDVPTPSAIADAPATSDAGEPAVAGSGALPLTKTFSAPRERKKRPIQGTNTARDLRPQNGAAEVPNAEINKPFEAPHPAATDRSITPKNHSKGIGGDATNLTLF